MALHTTSQKGSAGVIWLTCRQHRLEAAIGMALLGLISLMLLVTGLHMASVYQDTGVAACAARDVQGGPCQGVEGVTPAAYTVFALALLLAAGSLLRRAVPAIGITLGGFLVARVGLETWALPHYVSPALKLVPSNATKGMPPGIRPTDWVLGGGYSDRFGHPLSDQTFFRLCSSMVRGTATKTTAQSEAYAQCARAHHIFDYVAYQPASRFWLLQGIEGAVFVGMAAVLLVITIWWVRYRAT